MLPICNVATTQLVQLAQLDIHYNLENVLNVMVDQTVKVAQREIHQNA